MTLLLYMGSDLFYSYLFKFFIYSKSWLFIFLSFSFYLTFSELPKLGLFTSNSIFSIFFFRESFSLLKYKFYFVNSSDFFYSNGSPFPASIARL